MDDKVLLLPLEPARLRHLRSLKGIKKWAARRIAHAVSPISWVLRLWLSSYKPHFAGKIKQADPLLFEQIFERSIKQYRRRGIVTTYRDSEFFQYRYVECPFGSQMRYYVGGRAESPSTALVARSLNTRAGREFRILDLFGDFSVQDDLEDVLRLAIKDAVNEGSIQITVRTSLPEVLSVLRRNGFLFSTKGRFCWYCKAQGLMKQIDGSRSYWSISDADNDEPLESEFLLSS